MLIIMSSYNPELVNIEQYIKYIIILLAVLVIIKLYETFCGKQQPQKVIIYRYNKIGLQEEIKFREELLRSRNNGGGQGQRGQQQY